LIFYYFGKYERITSSYDDDDEIIETILLLRFENVIVFVVVEGRILLYLKNKNKN
jgi:hypothetical protein